MLLQFSLEMETLILGKISLWDEKSPWMRYETSLGFFWGWGLLKDSLSHPYKSISGAHHWNPNQTRSLFHLTWTSQKFHSDQTYPAIGLITSKTSDLILFLWLLFLILIMCDRNQLWVSSYPKLLFSLGMVNFITDKILESHAIDGLNPSKYGTSQASTSLEIMQIV